MPLAVALAAALAGGAQAAAQFLGQPALISGIRSRPLARQIKLRLNRIHTTMASVHSRPPNPLPSRFHFMPRTLSVKDPNLIAAVARLQRTQQLWGLLLIGLGLVTELAAGSAHPVAGLAFIAVGFFAFRWAEPALLATGATVVAFSIVPSINPRLTILGPDPLTQVAVLSLIELIALVIGKGLIVLTMANQFFIYRFLYGTARASSEDPDLALIPAMVPNRTNGLARSARWMVLIGLALGALGFGFSVVSPGAFQAQVLAETAGTLAVVAIGLGVGCAFSPTDERLPALASLALGIVGYIVAAVVLLRLPG